MAWCRDQLFLSRPVSADRDSLVVAAAYGASPDRVRWCDPDAPGVQAPDHVDLVALFAPEPIGGQFPWALEILANADSIAPVELRDVATRLTRALGCDALWDDGTSDPLSWWLTSATGLTERVLIDATAFELRDELVVAGPVDDAIDAIAAAQWDLRGVAYPARADEASTTRVIREAIRQANEHLGRGRVAHLDASPEQVDASAHLRAALRAIADSPLDTLARAELHIAVEHVRTTCGVGRAARETSTTSVLVETAEWILASTRPSRERVN